MYSSTINIFFICSYLKVTLMEMILPEIYLKFPSLHNGLELILLGGETEFH